jgi:hypothetical protein
MLRGLFRWQEEAGDKEIWWARVDRGHGEWDTLSEEQYVIERGEPDFWDLPLKDDHLRGATFSGTV